MNEKGMVETFVTSDKSELDGTTVRVTEEEKIAFSGPVMTMAVTCCAPREVPGNTTENV
jgi:hypothetical protein